MKIGETELELIKSGGVLCSFIAGIPAKEQNKELFRNEQRHDCLNGTSNQERENGMCA